MNFFSISNKTPAFIFSFFVFAVMPFAYSDRLLDPELALRFICIALLVFLFFGCFFLKRNKISLPPVSQKLTLIFIVYIAFSAISIFISINRIESLYEFIRLLIFLLFYFCLLILIYKQDDSLLTIIKNINIAILIFSAIGLTQFIPHLKNYVERGMYIDIKIIFSSALSNKNFYAETILMSLPFIVYGIFRLKKFWKGISVFNFIIIFITIFSLQTISAWLGLFISFLLIVFFYKRCIFENKKIRIITLVITAVAVLISAVAIYSNNLFFKAIESRMSIALKYINNPEEMEKYSTKNDNSTFERIILWRNSLRMIREHPVSGVGLGEWKIYFPKYGMGMAPYMNTGMIRFEKPHNDFLLVCCETGLPGLICYLALFIIAFRYCRKIIEQTKDEKDKLLFRLMTAALAGFLAISLFGYPNQRPFTMVFLMLIFAVIQSKYIQLFPPKENFKTKKIL